MKKVFAFAALAAGTISSPSLAEVVHAESGGFTVSNSTTIEASRGDTWQAAVQEVGLWWNGDHTISGDATRISIDARPMGCFCETLGEDAGVVHLVVTMVSPQVVIRLTGGLGPLGLMGVAGNMTWEFEPAGDATKVSFTYAVGGHREGGLEELAAPVDGVIEDALLRLKAHVESPTTDDDQRD